ncbi:MAG: TonB-dependent receptor [Flavobacteriales bacterium]|nr:TonB-dependent receptor [Flavobacteriales bacterium]
MRTLKSLCIAIFISSGIWVHAQEAKIKGEVRSDINEGVPFASIILSQISDSSLVKATTTDVNGGFAMNNVPQGDYFLSVTYVGFRRYDSDQLKINGEDITIEPIIMESEAVSLDAVTVTAEKPMIEVMADKTVFNVENVGGTAGLSGFELLRRSPGVIVDNNDNVIVEGKSGVQIWIDGKPSVLTGDDLVNYLRSIQASDIESIEIITQPSSKYDAQGTGGIINIKLKRDKRYGTNGSASLGLGYWEYLKGNSSVSINNRTRKTNLYATYSNRMGETFNAMNFRQQIDDQVYFENSRNVRNFNNHNLKAGLDIFATTKSTFGVIVTGNYSDGGSHNRSTTEIIASSEDATEALLRAETIDEYTSDNAYFNANYRFEDTLGHSLNVDLDYGFHNNERVSDQPNRYFNREESELLSEFIYRMETPLSIDILSLKADYEQDLWNGKLGLGFKGSEVTTVNSFGFFQEIEGDLQFQPERSNDFEYTEEVLAAYFNYSYRNDKWSYQFGLRAENTHSTGELFATQQSEDSLVVREYLNWFPSGGVTYQVNQKNSVGLNYSRRINRPNYESLNPFQYRLNELGFRQGNPFLQPNYTHNVRLSHTFNYRLTTSVSYTYVEDFFAQVTDTLAAGGTFGDLQPSYIQERNVADEEVWSVNVSYPFDVNNWWSVYFSATFYNTSYTSIDPKFNPLNQSTFNFYGQNTFKMPKDWRFEVSGWFNTRSIWGGTFVTEPLGSLDMALQRKFFDKKLSASLSISDIFYTSPWRAAGEFNNLPITGGGQWESRQLRLNLTYNFGNPELKASRKRKTATEEERSRIQ